MNLRKYLILGAARLAAHRPTAVGRLPIRLVEGLTSLDTRVVRGQTRSGHEASILFAGQANGFSWFLDRFFATPPTVEPRPPLPLPRVRSTLLRAAPEFDFVAASIDRAISGLVARRDFVRSPHWVRFELQTPRSSEPFQPPCRNLVRTLRRARQDGLTARLVSDDASIQHFCRELHTPFIHARFGADAHARPLPTLRWTVRRGGLIQILHQGRVIGGLVFDRRGDTLVSLALGQLPLADAHLRSGVGAAVYFHLIETARELGCPTIDFGGCRPALEDGVFVFKRKWGMSVAPNIVNPTEVVLRWETVTPAVEAFFGHTSLVVRQPDGFAAIASGDDDHLRSLATPGVPHRLRPVAGAPFACSLVAEPFPT